MDLWGAPAAPPSRPKLSQICAVFGNFGKIVDLCWQHLRRILYPPLLTLQETSLFSKYSNSSVHIVIQEKRTQRDGQLDRQCSGGVRLYFHSINLASSYINVNHADRSCALLQIFNFMIGFQ